MPIYGRKSIARARKPTREKRLTPKIYNNKIIRPKLLEEFTSVKRQKRQISYTENWGYLKTPVNEIFDILGIPKSRISKILKRKKKPIIVDWGCGKGNAIGELQKKFPKARCFGFGDLYFPEWEEQRNTTFIHAPGEDFSRYFKNGSIDFMYSYCGLEHLNLGEKVQEYYCMLANKLALEGELFNHGLYSIIWRVFGWEAQHKIYQASLKAQKKPYKVDFTWELGKKKFKITYQSRNSILIIKRIE